MPWFFWFCPTFMCMKDYNSCEWLKVPSRTQLVFVPCPKNVDYWKCSFYPSVILGPWEKKHEFNKHLQVWDIISFFRKFSKTVNHLCSIVFLQTAGCPASSTPLNKSSGEIVVDYFGIWYSLPPHILVFVFSLSKKAGNLISRSLIQTGNATVIKEHTILDVLQATNMPYSEIFILNHFNFH